MTFDQFKTLAKTKLDRTIKDSVGELTVQIRDEAPVKTGKSRAGYTLVQTPGGWAMINTVTGANNQPYVPKLWFGWSQQLPQGHFPTVDRWKYTLKQAIENTTF